MRRRCCCTPLLGNCFNSWDQNCGPANRPGSVVTLSWTGGTVTTSGLFSTFGRNPTTLPGFTPDIGSGSLELQYVGAIGSGLSQSCIYNGQAPIAMTFPEITLPDDYREDGSGAWASGFRCSGVTITRQFSDLALMINATLTISPSYLPFFKGELGIFSVYDRYYDRLLGLYNWPPVRYEATDAIDSADCSGTDCDGVTPIVGNRPSRPFFYQLVRPGGDPPIEAISFCAGRGLWTPLGGFSPYVIPPDDWDCAARTMRVAVGFDATVTRFLCTPRLFSEGCPTDCAGVTFGFRMDNATGVLQW